jgi:hypothetical protein
MVSSVKRFGGALVARPQLQEPGVSTEQPTGSVEVVIPNKGRGDV